MKYSNDNLLLAAIRDSKVSTKNYILISEKTKSDVLNKFIDYSKLKDKTYPRFFEGMVDSTVNYGNDAFKRFLALSLEGNFIVFTEEGKKIIQINNWDDVKAIIAEIPAGLNVYITNKDYEFLIALTEEDNILMSGNIVLPIASTDW